MTCEPVCPKAVQAGLLLPLDRAEKVACVAFCYNSLNLFRY